VSTPQVTVTKRGVLRAQSGHPWIYRSDVLKTGGAKGGDAVKIVDERGWFVATAFYSAHSQITLRLLSREDLPADELVSERLRLAVELRQRLFPEATGVRLVHGEGDLLPGLVVDRYGDALSIQLLTEATDRRREAIVDRLVELTGARTVVERSDVSSRRKEGLQPLKQVLRGKVEGPVEYREGEVTLVADLMEGQKTGAFLDQRENHVLAGELAFGRALDCFSYHGGFALQLARRATSVVAVESSDKAVEEIARNAQRNGLSNVETRLANAFDFLRAEADSGARYDFIVLDPPAFTKSKDAIDAAMRGYKEINLRAMSLLKPGGMLVTASCSYHVDEARFEAMLVDAAKDSGRALQVVERRCAGRDRPVLAGMPESRYLKCSFCRVL
jgi:23S rRNA (cytosine1962-C5)-methyltransferase